MFEKFESTECSTNLSKENFILKALSKHSIFKRCLEGSSLDRIVPHRKATGGICKGWLTAQQNMYSVQGAFLLGFVLIDEQCISHILGMYGMYISFLSLVKRVIGVICVFNLFRSNCTYYTVQDIG